MGGAPARQPVLQAKGECSHTDTCSLRSRLPGIWRNTSEEGSQLHPTKVTAYIPASQIILDVAECILGRIEGALQWP